MDGLQRHADTRIQEGSRDYPVQYQTLVGEQLNVYGSLRSCHLNVGLSSLILHHLTRGPITNQLRNSQWS